MDWLDLLSVQGTLKSLLQHNASKSSILLRSAFFIVLPMNIQDWSPLRWTGWISLQSKGLSRVFNTTIQKHQFFSTQLSFYSNSHIHTWLLEKPQPWLDAPLSRKSLLFDMPFRLVITFLPKSKRLLISWLQSPSAVIFGVQKNSQPLFPLFPHLYAMKWWDWMPWYYFLYVEF